MSGCRRGSGYGVFLRRHNAVCQSTEQATLQNERTEFEEKARRELDLAANTTDKATKAAHLDLAAKYATMGEKSVAPHRTEKPSI